MRRGLDVDQFVPQLSFFFNAHNDFFEEIAKYRAARRIWHKAMVERYKSKNPRSWALRFHTQTAGCSLTAQQPYNNVVRTAIQALAAVLGGTQSLHTNSLDEAWALPTEFAATIALRTQQIIAHETGVTNTVDAGRGQRQRQPHALHLRRREILRHPRRNLRRPARRLWHLRRSRHYLTHAREKNKSVDCETGAGWP